MTETMPPVREAIWRSRVHAESLVRFGADKPDVVVLSGDLTSSTEADGFKAAYPDRFFTMGMAEQNMMSVAGGLAREGLTPFVHTFAVFMYRRALDQIEMSIAYPNLPVKIVGFLPGITTPGGVSHQAINDLAVLRSVPNMTVLECGDAADVESILDVAYGVDGPVYLRMLRGSMPELFDGPMLLGQARQLGPVGDVLLLTSGICTGEGMRAVEALRAVGVEVGHLHISTLKPFDDPRVLDALSANALGVVTAENHTIIGGLGSAVAELMAENGIGRKLVRLGLQDTYAHGASEAYLVREYGLGAQAIADAIGGLAGAERVDVGDDMGDASAGAIVRDTPDEDL